MFTELIVGFASAQFFINLVMIDNIVSMIAAWHGLQVRRTVNVRDTECVKIIGDICRGIKIEFRV